MTENKKPRVNSEGEKELIRAEEQFKAFDDQVKEMTLDRMNMAPKNEVEPQTKLSDNQIAKTTDLYLKPKRTIRSREVFNERYREKYNFAKEYVHFMAENKEIIGEAIEMWTKPFPGMPAEEWVVPVNKPLWAPRYVAEQIKRKYYHRLTMQNHVNTGGDQNMQFYGSMAVDTTVQRLDAVPISTRKSLFFGANNF